MSTSEERNAAIDEFWDWVRENDALVIREPRGRGEGKKEHLIMYVEPDRLESLCEQFIFDYYHGIRCRLIFGGAAEIDLSEDDLCGCLNYLDSAIWRRRPEGCREAW